MKQQTAFSRVLGKAPVTQLLENCKYFMEPKDSLPCLQEPSTGPYPEQDQSSPYHLFILSTHPCPDYPSGLSPCGFPTSNNSNIHAMCLVNLNLLNSTNLIKLGSEYKLWSSPLCSFLQWLLLSLIQMFSAAYSQTTPVCVSPLMSETKFTPIQNCRQNNSLVYSYVYVFNQQKKRQKVTFTCMYSTICFI
jgi:hypothetical protein